jgi:hypothetical protein
MRMRIGLVIATSAVMAVSACGGSDDSAAKATSAVTTASSARATATSKVAATTTEPAPPTTTLPDPCVVVSKADASQLAGATLEDGVKAGPGDDMSCTYAGPTTGPTAQVEFYVGDGAKKFLDVDRDLGHEITAVPGVGDEAYIEDFNIFFHTGNHWNALRLVRLDDFAAYKQPMIDLATKIAAKG